MATNSKPRVPAKLQPWVEARQKFRLSHAHVQMARELGLNPKKLGKIDNHDQEPWKQPLPDFIAKLYRKRFGKDRPDQVLSIEDGAAAKHARQQVKKARKAERRAASNPNEVGTATATRKPEAERPAIDE